MTEENAPLDEGANIDGKTWAKPTVRAVIPARRTHGGGSTMNDQDDANYDLS